MELLGGVAVVGLIWYGSTQIKDGSLTQGEFASFVAAAFMMYGPIKKLSRVNATIQQASLPRSGSSRCWIPTPKSRSVPAPRRSRSCGGPSSSATSASRTTIVRGRTSCATCRSTCRSGQVVAIVGLSGAGKTTLVNLVPRFYDVTAGAILIDGVDIRDVTLASLRSQIGIVTQETVLFDETIASNIAYGAAGGQQGRDRGGGARGACARVHRRARRPGTRRASANAASACRAGSDSGSRSRRALLKNSPILILDEATSSLDAQSELLVQDALQNLMRNRTSFVIAHRLSTVRRADAIIVLERGRVVEVGRHEELLARPGGVYAKLYSLQMFETRDAPSPSPDRQPSVS